MIGRPRERGAALVVTLIFAAAMAAAAVAFIAGRQTDALALRGQLQGVEAQAMLEAALQQTVTVLNNRESRQRVPSQISWQFGDVTVRVQIASESGKIDLNKAEKPMLQGLAQAVGLPQAAAQAIADSVLDWRDENKAKLAHGAEGRDYRSSDRGTTGTADRPFAHPAELRYVLPVDATAWAALAPFVTVYSGEAEPEASKAAGPVRRAMGIAQQLTDAELTKAQSDQSSSSATGDSSRSSSGQSDSLLPKSEGQSSTLSSLSSGRASGASSGTSSTGRSFEQLKLCWRPFRQPDPRQHPVQTPVAERTARKQQRREWQPGQSRRRRHHRRPDPCAGRPVPQRLRGRGQSRDRPQHRHFGRQAVHGAGLDPDRARTE